jgi:hypothetical protein
LRACRLVDQLLGALERDPQCRADVLKRQSLVAQTPCGTPCQLRGLGLTAGGPLAQFGGPVQFGPDVSRQDDRHVEVERVSRDVVHNGDEIASHGPGLPERARLGGARDLGHADAPDRAVAADFSVVRLQFRHQPASTGTALGPNITCDVCCKPFRI